MKVLFIGGTGIISSGCAPEALEQGIQLSLLNRGQSFRPTPEGAEVLLADYHDRSAVEQAIAGRDFDVQRIHEVLAERPSLTDGYLHEIGISL